MPTLEVRLLRRGAANERLAVPFAAEDSVGELAARVAASANTTLAGLRLCFRGQLLLDGTVTLHSLGLTESHFMVALAETADAMRLAWIDASNGAVPTGAVRAGLEADGTPLYAARVAHGGGVHPGKLAAPLGGCRAGYGGQELVVSAYQALVATDKQGRAWPAYHPLPLAEPRRGVSSLPSLPVTPGGRVPGDALAAGYESDGTRLFAAMGRDAAGGVCPGKIQSGWANGCSVGWGGSERNLHPCHCLTVPSGTRPPRDDDAPAQPQIQLRRFLGSIEELLAWSEHDVPEGVEPPPPDGATHAGMKSLKAGPRVLHCHDMKGGYCRSADEDYLAAFGGWEAIDVFVYFAHHRVCVPPRCWIDACHARGLPCLGTLITEGPSGARDNALMLQRSDDVAEKLTELCAAYGFDGWLINIEAPVHPTAVPSLVELLQLLTICTKQRLGDHALVLYYDSLDATTGRVAYQNALSHANRTFFDACDGIFTNYWWRQNHLAASAALAGRERRYDVYVGVDCFARGDLLYTAGEGCAAGLKLAADAGLSVAVFAPGWSLECGEASGKEGEEAAQCDARFWQAIGAQRLFGPR